MYAIRRQDQYREGLLICVMGFAYREGELKNNLGVSSRPQIPREKVI